MPNLDALDLDAPEWDGDRLLDGPREPECEDRLDADSLARERGESAPTSCMKHHDGNKRARTPIQSHFCWICRHDMTSPSSNEVTDSNIEHILSASTDSKRRAVKASQC